jgi:hypothetical protein
MNSRRLIDAPEGSGRGIVAAQTYTGKGPTHVCFTPKAEMCGKTRYVRFGPKADIQDGYDRSSRNAIAAMLNMRGHERFTDSDLVYWLARRSRTTIQIKLAIISVPPRADASAQ